jgi:formamidopyrimidine-DNA glycosylase
VPELPEVEALRRSLLPHLPGAKVVAIDIHRPDIITRNALTRARPAAARTHTPATPADLLVGDTITHLDRRGKHLLIAAASGKGLVIHLGMTGDLHITTSPPPTLPTPPALPPHTHLCWHLRTPAGPATLAFRDPRRFGGVIIIPSLAALPTAAWAHLGPDALTIDPAHLHTTLRHSRRPLKAALLDQRVLAGVGNIYADEACYRARLNPATRCPRLTPAHWATLATHLRAILAEAINARGSTIRDYRTADGTPGAFAAHHAVYNRAGQPCRRCTTTLRSTRLAGRTTTWCPACQPTRPQ